MRDSTTYLYEIGKHNQAQDEHAPRPRQAVELVNGKGP